MATVSGQFNFAVSPAPTNQPAPVLIKNPTFVNDVPAGATALTITNPPAGAWTYSAASGLLQTYNTTTGSGNILLAWYEGWPWQAYLDNGGTISQSLSFPVSGDYSLAVIATNMPNQRQTISVSLDGTAQGTFQPPQGQWPQIYSASTITLKAVTAGQHTLTLTGTVAGQRGVLAYVMLEPAGLGSFVPIMKGMPNPNLTEYVPDPAINPTVVAPWTTPPTVNDIVRIPAGVAVNQGTDFACKYLTIDAGGSFTTTQKINITYSTILVKEGGSFIDEHSAVMTFVPQAFDPDRDPFQYWNGTIRLGTWQKCGTAKTTFVRLAKAPAAGDTTLTLATPLTGIQPKDQLVLGDSRQLGPADMNGRMPAQIHNEIVNAHPTTPTSTDGLTVNLDPQTPVKYAHPAGLNSDGTIFRYSHVGNLTRDSKMLVVNPNQLGILPHNFSADSAMVEECYTEFDDQGRTQLGPLSNKNINSRYGIHFHHCMMPQSFTGNSIRQTTARSKWGLTIHGTHWSLFQGNAIYNVLGTGIRTQDSSEFMNTIDTNFIVGVQGNGVRRDPDCGDGIWLGGPFNVVTNNVACCCYGTSDVYAHGFSLWFPTNGGLDIKVSVPPTAGAPVSQWVTKSVNLSPIQQFSSNECYGCTPQGITWGNVGTTGGNVGCVSASSSMGTIDGQVIWNTHASMLMYESAYLTVNNLQMRGGIGMDGTRINGITFNDYYTLNFTLQNSDIRGCNAAVIAPNWAPGTTTFKGNTMQNVGDIVVLPMSALASTVASAALPPRHVVIDDTGGSHLAMPGQPLNAVARGINAQFHGGENWIQSDTVTVQNFQGTTGDNFTVYSTLQVANGPVINGVLGVPQTSGDVTGCPVGGLTNTQALAQYHVCIHGAIAPATATTRAGIGGLVA